jgi:hypothetical protein
MHAKKSKCLSGAGRVPGRPPPAVRYPAAATFTERATSLLTFPLVSETV